MDKSVNSRHTKEQKSVNTTKNLILRDLIGQEISWNENGVKKTAKIEDILEDGTFVLADSSQ